MMTGQTTLQTSLPGHALQTSKMPGHWLLARLGKRVLRPGGLHLTQQMLDALDIQPTDDVVEFAPGFGLTTQLTLRRKPATYTAIERDEAAAQHVRRYLQGPQQRCQIGSAEASGLPAASATVLYGEAMLTMQPPSTKEQIMREAYRVLKPGGRYGIHELCLIPDDLPKRMKDAIEHALSQAIHVGARPLTPAEWRQALESCGFTVRSTATAPMHLLEPERLIQDEGFIRTVRFVWNVMRDREARQRVMAMRRTFRHYRTHLAAILVIAVKPE
ncbi:MAG: methyltransferase domain-containing protein [Candidatus Binatia bacterium]|nr:methyltransferase domain-containing protein [Candidatus Binatia bacterium]